MRVPGTGRPLLEQRLRTVRERRDGSVVQCALESLRRAADYSAGNFGEPLMPLIVDTVRARATLGEISDALAANWGTYRPGA